jgi:hypothetical protein
MTQVAQVAALAAALVSLVAGVLGAWYWWRVEPSSTFWLLCRAGQALLVVQALVAGVLAALGFDPADGLYWLYALLPVGELDDARQRSIVLAIVRREMGVMTASALVVVFLALRAWGTA